MLNFTYFWSSRSTADKHGKWRTRKRRSESAVQRSVYLIFLLKLMFSLRNLTFFLKIYSTWSVPALFFAKSISPRKKKVNWYSFYIFIEFLFSNWMLTISEWCRFLRCNALYWSFYSPYSGDALLFLAPNIVIIVLFKISILLWVCLVQT